MKQRTLFRSLNVRLMLVGWALIVLAGCSQSVNIQLAPEVSVFHSSDPKHEIRLAADHPAYQEFNAWLTDNPDGWYGVSGRFQGGVFIQTGVQGIQVLNTEVVLYAKQQGGLSATHVHEIGPGELNNIKQLHRNADNK